MSLFHVKDNAALRDTFKEHRVRIAAASFITLAFGWTIVGGLIGASLLCRQLYQVYQEYKRKTYMDVFEVTPLSSMQINPVLEPNESESSEEGAELLLVRRPNTPVDTTDHAPAVKIPDELNERVNHIRDLWRRAYESVRTAPKTEQATVETILQPVTMALDAPAMPLTIETAVRPSTPVPVKPVVQFEHDDFALTRLNKFGKDSQFHAPYIRKTGQLYHSPDAHLEDVFRQAVTKKRTQAFQNQFALEVPGRDIRYVRNEAKLKSWLATHPVPLFSFEEDIQTLIELHNTGGLSVKYHSLSDLISDVYHLSPAENKPSRQDFERILALNDPWLAQFKLTFQR